MNTFKMINRLIREYPIFPLLILIVLITLTSCTTSSEINMISETPQIESSKISNSENSSAVTNQQIAYVDSEGVILFSVGDQIKEKISDDNTAINLNWSPDGSELIYFSEVTGECQLHSINIDSGNLSQLTYTFPGANCSYAGKVAWSLNGKRIAFLVGNEPFIPSITETDIYILEKGDVSFESILLGGEGFKAYDFFWVNDSMPKLLGNKLMSTDEVIYLFDLNNWQITQMSQDIGRNPKVSVDGTRISFYCVDVSGRMVTDLCIVDSDGQNYKKTQISEVESHAWAPNGDLYVSKFTADGYQISVIPSGEITAQILDTNITGEVLSVSLDGSYVLVRPLGEEIVIMSDDGNLIASLPINNYNYLQEYYPVWRP